MPSSHHDVVIVGAGQAGLAMSHCLSRSGVDHVVLERHEVASAWRRHRWDSLRLLTPNWMTSLPGAPAFPGPPDAFAPAADVAAHLRAYAAGIAAPVITGCSVERLEPHHRGWRVVTSAGIFTSRAVVLATGPGWTPRLPSMSTRVPDAVRSLAALDYRNPDQLGDGSVLVVGASASGTQIADELARAGRDVTLAVGEHVRAVRSYRGRDLYWWLDRTGILDERSTDVDDLQRVRATPSFQLVGSDDGRDVDLNALQERGVRIAGRLAGGDADRLVFSAGLAHLCAAADLKLDRLLDRFDRAADDRDLDVTGDARRPARTRVPEPLLALPTDRLGTIVWATGLVPTFPAIAAPVLDRRGRLRHDGGVVGADGLFVMGLPFLRRRRSSFISGVGQDAAELAELVAAHLRRRRIA